MAYSQKVGAESAVDINLAKQLNVLMTQLGVAPTSIVMNAGSAAAGYGYEYVASTLDRIRAAALAQSDTQLQMPILTPVSPETWSVKESMVSEADMPNGAAPRSAALRWRSPRLPPASPAAPMPSSWRHPAAIKAISEMIEALV